MGSNGDRAERTWVVVLNYRGQEHIADCLASLEQMEPTPGGRRVFVVDNASDDDSVAIIRRDFPDIELHQSELNVGFAGGNNIGLQAAIGAGAEYVALLNMDARVDSRWLTELVSCADRAPDAALFGSRILTLDGKALEYDGVEFDPVTTSGGYDFHRPVDDVLDVRETAFACGAAMLARAGALKQVGLFDPDFFAYHEDVDLSLRCWLHGFKVLHVPAAKVFHAGGGAGAGIPFRSFMGLRNSLLAAFKVYDRETWEEHAEGITRHFLAPSLPANPAAALAGLHRLPAALRHRRNLQESSTVTYRQLVERLSRRR